MVNLMSFSFKEALQMPFITISGKIHCEDLLPLIPLSSLPEASSSIKIPASISDYEVLVRDRIPLII